MEVRLELHLTSDFGCKKGARRAPSSIAVNQPFRLPTVYLTQVLNFNMPHTTVSENFPHILMSNACVSVTKLPSCNNTIWFSPTLFLRRRSLGLSRVPPQRTSFQRSMAHRSLDYYRRNNMVRWQSVSLPFKSYFVP